MHQSTTVLLRVLLLATLLSCDPGYRLPPVGWTCSPSGLWSSDFQNFHLDYVEAGGLIGESWLHLEFQMIGNRRAFRLDSAALTTSVGPFRPDETFRPQPIPSGGGAFQVWWKFGRDQPAFHVLHDTSQVTLFLSSKSGGEQVSIRYVWNTDTDGRCRPAA